MLVLLNKTAFPTLSFQSIRNSCLWWTKSSNRHMHITGRKIALSLQVHFLLLIIIYLLANNVWNKITIISNSGVASLLGQSHEDSSQLLGGWFLTIALMHQLRSPYVHNRTSQCFGLKKWFPCTRVCKLINFFVGPRPNNIYSGLRSFLPLRPHLHGDIWPNVSNFVILANPK